MILKKLLLILSIMSTLIQADMFEDIMGKKVPDNQMRYIGIKYLSGIELTAEPNSYYNSGKTYDAVGLAFDMKVDIFQTTRLSYGMEMNVFALKVEDNNDLSVVSDDGMVYGLDVLFNIKHRTFFDYGKNINYGINIGGEFSLGTEMETNSAYFKDDVGNSFTYAVEPFIGIEIAPFNFEISYKKTGEYTSTNFALIYKVSGTN